MTYVPTKEVKIKERQDKFLKAQLEKEREQALLDEIEKTEKERVKKKGLKVLKQSGILDAYQGLLVSLCKYGLPTEDLYEFSALTILKHEKKLKAQRKKELEERLKQRNDQKQLAPIRARAASNNAGAAQEQLQRDLAGISPAQAKNKLGSKRRAVGAASVERPQLGNMANQRGSLPESQTSKKNQGSKVRAVEAELEAREDEKVPMDGGQPDMESQGDDQPKKHKKSKKTRRSSQRVDDDEARDAASVEEAKVPAEQEPELEGEQVPKKKKKKKVRESKSVERDDEGSVEEAPPKKKRRNRDESVEEEVPEAEGAEPPKKKKKKKAREPEPAAEEEEINIAADEAPEEEAPKKKKKKKKHAAEDE